MIRINLKNALYYYIFLFLFKVMVRVAVVLFILWVSAEGRVRKCILVYVPFREVKNYM